MNSVFLLPSPLTGFRRDDFPADSFEGFGAALVFMRAVLTLAFLERCHALTCLYMITTVFGFISASAFQQFCSILIEFKIHHELIDLAPGQIRGHDLYVVFLRKSFIDVSSISAIRYYGNCFGLFSHFFDGIFHELAVAVGILLILILGDNASVFSGYFCNICCISAVLPSGFFTKSGIGISRILENGWHSVYE